VTFALLSDSNVQMNSKFIRDRKDLTYLGPTCIRSCNQTVVLRPDGSVETNGRLHKMTFSGQVLLDAPALRFEMLQSHPTSSSARISVPGKWTFEISMLGDRINIDHVMSLKSDASVHGVLGHTLGREIPQDHAKCNGYEEGGCQVEGTFDEYEVSGELCSTVWPHATYSGETCQI